MPVENVRASEGDLEVNSDLKSNLTLGKSKISQGILGFSLAGPGFYMF